MTRTKQQTVNTRVFGTAIYTPISELPERFTFGPHTQRMSTYLARRWKAASHGWWKRETGIEYNREYSPTDRKYEHYRWIERPEQGLRLVGPVHEITNDGDYGTEYISRPLVKHTGWSMDDDEFQDETAHGLVFRLPSRNGKLQFVPAYSDAYGNDGAALDFRSVTHDLRQAIYNADTMAEIMAEEEREYQRKERAKERIEECKEKIVTARSAFKTLAKEVRANCDKLAGLDKLKDLIRSEYRRMRRTVSKLASERDRLQEEL